MSRAAEDGRTSASLAQLAPVLGPDADRVGELLERTEERLTEIGESYGEPLAGWAAGTLAAGGKRLRPILVFLCAGRGERSRDAALVHAGAAVELLHTATLVHDDVLDRAALRRGRPTVFSTAGRGAATATGDLLFSRAFGELAQTGHAEAVAALSGASSALARGELMQREDAWSPAVTPERYLERCALKTARLFDAACRIGALLGRLDRAHEEAFGAFGAAIGVAFQVFDDVLDVSGPPERTGKHRGTDLLDGTVTLPLILARRRDPALARHALGRQVTTPEEAEVLCERIIASGALREARGEALAHVARAKAALVPLPLGAEQRRALEFVADGVVERYS